MRHVLPFLLPVMLGAMSPTTDRTPEQRQFDFVLGDWSVVRVRSRGLFISPDATVERVRRVLESRGWCPAETRHPVARVQKST